MLLRAQLAVLVVLVVLNIWLGIDHDLYMSVPFWDVPTHFLGGVWMGFFAAWLFKRNKHKISIGQCAAFALSIGICWEIFEFSEGLTYSPFMPYWVDTIKDLCMDTVGGAAAGALVARYKILWRK